VSEDISATSTDEISTCIAPGILLACGVTAAAFLLRTLPGLALFSPMILAVAVGIAVSAIIGKRSRDVAGLRFGQRSLLRIGIILLGFQLTWPQLTAIGGPAVIVIALSLAACFVFTVVLGWILRVDSKLCQLIAAGTSICGVSAIVAANAVVSARDEDVAYAVATITLFGTVGMLAYPLLVLVLDLNSFSYGLWAGASIHEVAQVVGASFQQGEVAGEVGVVAKLVRVAMLAPTVLLLGVLARRETSDLALGKVHIPWFIFGFIGIVVINSTVDLHADLRRIAGVAATLMLTIGLASLGLQANISSIRSRGLGPLLLGLAASVFIACSSLALIKLLEPG